MAPGRVIHRRYRPLVGLRVPSNYTPVSPTVVLKKSVLSSLDSRPFTRQGDIRRVARLSPIIIPIGRRQTTPPAGYAKQGGSFSQRSFGPVLRGAFFSPRRGIRQTSPAPAGVSSGSMPRASMLALRGAIFTPTRRIQRPSYTAISNGTFFASRGVSTYSSPATDAVQSGSHRRGGKSLLHRAREYDKNRDRLKGRTLALLLMAATHPF